MSEDTRNPLSAFLESKADSATDNPFGDMSFFDPTSVQEQPHPTPVTPEAPPEETPQPEEPTPPAEEPAPPAAVIEDPFAAAMAKAKAKSEERLIDGFAERDAVFCYGKAKDPITNRDSTFEDLRQRYETDFPELSEGKKVSWTVTYGKVTKTITNPGGDKVYDIKAEIEKSKAFLDGIKKAKTDAEKNPECIIKPRITGQSKGEMPPPSYKDYCSSLEDARQSNKSIVVLPSKDGRLYQMRKTPVGIFTAPADRLPEFSQITPGFEMLLPKIPQHILAQVIGFFSALSKRSELEALVHILYDTRNNRYILSVPQQSISHASVRSVMETDYPEEMIHVMDIHSHNTMPAEFSAVDDKDEQATRLYAVVGRLDRFFPDIRVRASCGGHFQDLDPEDIFESGNGATAYPSAWDDRIVIEDTLPPKPRSASYYRLRGMFR